jgi:two-component system phosphate regulon sensor histidine kinase PhoR
MRRQLLVYVLIPAVLLAAAGLAYYSYRLSSDVAQREQRAILDTTRELAQEKVYGIESELIKSDTAIFEGADIENLLEFQQKLAAERPAVQSVVLLDEDWKNIPGGSFNRRRAKADMERFRQLFEIQVVPDLKAMGAGLNSRSHIHTVYDGRPYLFSFTRRISGGRLIYVVVEADLTHLVFTVFPEYFANKQSRVYQVVDDLGEIRYGYPFTNVPESRIVELRFPETVSGWRLRVAQPEAGLQAARGTRQFLDLALIGTALVVIVAGIGVLLLAARRERLANELKSEFISNVSHELKTPLSIIHMFGEMLHTGRTKSPEQARDYAGVITRESTRLARLIDNVLDFSRIERGADFYEFTDDGDLAGVVERGIDIYRHRLERVEMQLELEVEPDLPPLRIDENAMTLALLNLVDNAIKYAPSGKHLRVALARSDGGVALSVADAGPGIPAEEHRRIFERFYRSQSVRLKSARGSGIGLALVKHIAEAHGGNVSVDSSPGDGTTFTIWIPMAGA